MTAKPKTPPAPLTGKRALNFRRSMAAHMRMLSVDLACGNIKTREQYEARWEEHQQGLRDRGLRPLTAEEVRNPSTITAE